MCCRRVRRCRKERPYHLRRLSLHGQIDDDGCNRADDGNDRHCGRQTAVSIEVLPCEAVFVGRCLFIVTRLGRGYEVLLRSILPYRRFGATHCREPSQEWRPSRGLAKGELELTGRPLTKRRRRVANGAPVVLLAPPEFDPERQRVQQRACSLYCSFSDFAPLTSADGARAKSGSTTSRLTYSRIHRCGAARLNPDRPPTSP